MVSSKLLVTLGLASLAAAQCPFADPGRLAARAEGSSREHLEDYEVDDSKGYMSSDVGGPFEEQESLKAGERGPTLLEDFIFRQKIMHFDHERVWYLLNISSLSCHLHVYRSPKEPSTPEVQELTVFSPALAILATLLQLLS